MLVKTAAVIFSLFFSVLAPSVSYGQQEEQMSSGIEINGKAVEVDFVGSKIVLDTGDGTSLFFVTDQTVITRGIDTISIEDIDQGDPLMVTYYVDKDGAFMAVRITDNNLADE